MSPKSSKPKFISRRVLPLNHLSSGHTTGLNPGVSRPDVSGRRPSSHTNKNIIIVATDQSCDNMKKRSADDLLISLLSSFLFSQWQIYLPDKLMLAL